MPELHPITRQPVYPGTYAAVRYAVEYPTPYLPPRPREEVGSIVDVSQPRRLRSEPRPLPPDPLTPTQRHHREISSMLAVVALICSAVGSVLVSAILTGLFALGAIGMFMESRRPDGRHTQRRDSGGKRSNLRRWV